MACYLRMTVRRSVGEAIMVSRPFGRREMVEGGLRHERGKGPRMTLNVRIDERDWFDFRGQLGSARRFLRRHCEELRRLTADVRVRSATIDFGVGDAIDGGRGPAAVSYYRLPADLVSIAGEAGVGLEISIYPVMRRMTKRGLR